MAERFDIEIVDKVPAGIARKIRDIGRASGQSASFVERLQRELNGLNASGVTQLTNAMGRFASAQARLVSANARLASATARTGQTQARAAVQAQRLAQAQTNTAISAQRLITAQNNAATSAARHQAASARLTQQLQRQQAAQQRAARGGAAGGGAAGGGGGAAGTFVGAASAALGVRSVLEATDAYQRYRNQIASVTATEKERIEVQNQLLQISRDTLAPLSGIITLYQRFSSTSQKLGLDQKELYTVITNIGKAVAISGATAQEAEGALRQLAQAFGANRLSGQELNSVLEQLPKAADVIAAQLGIARGELRGMANDGRVTAKDIAAAFSESGKGILELQSRFENLRVTLGQSRQIFADTFTNMIGKMGEATGASGALVNAMLFLARNMEFVIAGGTALFAVIVAGLVSSTIAQNAFNAAVLRNPYVIGAALLIGAIAMLAAFAERSKTAATALAELGNVGRNVIIFIAKGIAGWIQSLEQFANDVINIRNQLTGSDFANIDWTSGIEEFITKMEQAKVTAEGVSGTIAGWSGGVQSATGELTEMVHTTDSLREAMEKTNKELNDKLAQEAQTRENTLGIQKQQTAEQNNTTDAIGRSAKAAYQLYEALLMARNISASQALREWREGGKEGRFRLDPSLWRLAGGGPVSGGGTTTSDSIPAMLSNKEFVVNAEQATKHRALLEMINSGREPIKLFGGGSADYTNYGARDAEAATRASSAPVGKLDAYIAQLLDPRSGAVGSRGSVQAAATAGYWKRDYGWDQLLEDREKVRTWNKEIDDFWSGGKSAVATQDRGRIQRFISVWKSGNAVKGFPFVPRNSIDGGNLANPVPNPYGYEDIHDELAAVGPAIEFLSRIPSWGATVGPNVKMEGLPSYGSSITYGQSDFGKEIPAFQHGGAFTVQGDPGPDANLVRFMASRGEEVTVQTPQQKRNSESRSGGNNGPMFAAGAIQINAKDANSFIHSQGEVRAALARSVMQAVRDGN